MKKVLYGAFIFAAANSMLFSQQNIAERKTDYYFNRENYTNLYYSSGNPAMLHMDARDERLSIFARNNIDAGEFRGISTPERDVYYAAGASGKKNIDSAQTFKGSFYFDKEIRKSWNYIFTKNYSYSPFLLGDKTTGDSRFNGITLTAEYNYLVTKKLSLGAAVNYKVDEGLKQISPRPVSNHRTAGLSAGASYNFFEWLTAAAAFRTGDYSEEITYSEDEGGVNKETIILKYNGYGLPVSVSKKNENRKLSQNQYALNLGFSGTVAGNIKYTVHSEYGWMQEVSKDDASDPYRSGYLKGEYQEAAVNVLWQPVSPLDLAFTYSFRKDNDWARHAQYEVLIYNYENNAHSFSLDTKYQIIKNLGLLAGIDYAVASPDEKDHYSGFYGKAARTTSGVKAGLSTFLCDRLTLAGIYIYGNTEFDIKDLINPRSGRIADFMYRFTDYSSHSFELSADIGIGDSGTIGVFFSGMLVKPTGSNTIFSDGERFYSATGIDLKLKLY